MMGKINKSPLSDLFSAFCLETILEMVNSLIRVAVTSDNHYFDSFQERDRILWFQEVLTDCLKKEYERVAHKPVNEEGA